MSNSAVVDKKSSEKILLIDDEVGLLESMEHLVSRKITPNVVSTSTSRDALELIRREKPDLIVSDILMPDLTGVELLEQIRLAGILTPVIFVTAFGTKAYTLQALRLGAEDFLEKPFKTEEFLAIVYKRLEIIRRERAARVNPGSDSQGSGSRMMGLFKWRRPKPVRVEHPVETTDISDDFIKKSLRSAEVGLWAWNPRDDHWECDPTLLRILRMPVGKVPSEFVRETLHPEDRARLAEITSGADSNGFELRVRFKVQEETRTVMFRGKSDPCLQEQAPRVSGICWEVPEDRRDETTSHSTPLEINDEILMFRGGVHQLDLALDALHIGIWVWNLDTDQLGWDRRMRELHGVFDTREITPELWRSMLSSEDVQTFEKFVEQAKTMQGRRDFKFQVTQLNGETRWIKKSFVVGKIGNHTLLRGVSWDCSSEVAQEEGLARQRSANGHASRMSSLGEMATGIAHEINNPLSILCVWSSAIRDAVSEWVGVPNAPAGTAKVLKMAQSIEDTAIRISKVIKGLRAFAGISEHEAFEEVGVESILTDLNEICKTRLTKDKVALEIETFPNLKVRCRRYQIVQVLINLINNALDAVQGFDQKWIRIQVVPGDDHVSFRVVDCGLGLKAQVAEKIGQPFFSTKPVGSGMGLGLSIAMGIAQAHGGYLRYVDSEKHTTFEFRISLRPLEQDRNRIP